MRREPECMIMEENHENDRSIKVKNTTFTRDEFQVGWIPGFPAGLLSKIENSSLEMHETGGMLTKKLRMGKSWSGNADHFVFEQFTQSKF